MKTPALQSSLFLAFAALAGLAIATGCNESFAGGAKVVSAAGNQLTTSNEAGVQQTHEIAPDAEITLDGAAAEINELDAGDSVTVTLQQREGKDVATEIAAVSKESPEREPPADAQQNRNGQTAPQSGASLFPRADFTPLRGDEPPPVDPEGGAPAEVKYEEKTVDGQIASLGDDRLIVEDDGDARHTFAVNDETTYTVDGEEANFNDLEEGQTATVLAAMGDPEMVARTVEASTP